MKPIQLLTVPLLLLVLAGCLPPSQSQLRMEMDLEEMKRRLAQVEQGNAEILQDGGGPSRQQIEALSRQQAELQSGLDTLRVEFQSIYGRLDDLARENQQRGDDFGLVREDLGMQVSALEERTMKLEQRLEQQQKAAVVQQPAEQVASASSTAKIASSADSAEQLYKQGLDKIRNQQQYAAGRQQLEGFIKQYPKHDLLVNAVYWIGEALYGEKEYERAILQFQDVIQRYPNHPKAASAMFKQAFSFKSLGDNRNALTTFQKVINTFPKSPEAENAKQQIEALSKG
ncbi:MAG: tol-pal system protein YbgF [Desulfuromonas sp.]|jgi:tol-pal system protein YbgF|nr:MAG: tol-pal system protein YbgF [Desulfuromonas sp.]